ncbi:MAG: LysR family transcriptional regulator [Solirubrobacterales bacterium]|nr:LysR family transcriptional regulator [Solirubrobacterales bacterium]
MSITLTQLRSFLAVVRNGSVTGAAEELVVTQPSVSAAVAALSREVGVGLTERMGRTIRTSDAGKAFAPYASDVIGLLEQGQRAAREVGATSQRQLRIAAVTTAAEYVVPPLMQAFQANRPDLELTVEVGNRGLVFERAAEHAADVAIGGRPPGDGRLVGDAFLENEIAVIAPADDPLAKRRRVPVRELGDRAWLLREEGSGTRAMTEQFLASHELTPRVLTLGSNGAIKQASRAGLGVSLQSRTAVALELEAGLLSELRLREELPMRHWYLLRSSIGPVREAVRAFTEFVKQPQAREAVEAAQRGAGGLRSLNSTK